MRPRPAVFLDRDGTLIRDLKYLKDPKRIYFYKGACNALKKLYPLNYRLVMITNQSGIGRGFFGRRDLELVHRRMMEILKKNGVKLDGIFLCIHRPDQHCACRKPKLLLFRRAAKKLSIDFKKSYLIGDKLADVTPAKILGARGILVETGEGLKHRRESRTQGFRTVKNLKDAVNIIIKERM